MEKEKQYREHLKRAIVDGLAKLPKDEQAELIKKYLGADYGKSKS